MVQRVTVCAPAKINLTLDITGKREDGYHFMRMVMQSVDLCDRLELKLRTDGRFAARTDLSFLPNDDRNLAVMAARRFFAHRGQTGGLDVEIEKHIPVCAGLAGGSSDAAAVLRGLNELTGAGLTREELAAIGAQVGSDVPYCVLGGTALAEGRGERLTPLPALPACCIVLCKPPFAISTPELFGRIDSCRIVHRPDTEGVLAALERGDLTQAARRMYNVFEPVLPERQARVVAEIRAVLIQEGALGACMSGTGPTVFGLFREEETARNARDRLKESYQDTFLCRTV